VTIQNRAQQHQNQNLGEKPFGEPTKVPPAFPPPIPDTEDVPAAIQTSESPVVDVDAGAVPTTSEAPLAPSPVIFP